MLKILNKYKKILIASSFVYIYIVLMLIAPSNHMALTPGSIENTSGSYKISSVEFNNDINTISVLNWYEITTFQKWIIENNDKFYVDKIKDSDKSIKEQNIQGKISYESSHYNALITAYTYANKVDSKINIDYALKGLSVYDTNTNKLLIGDVILKINNKEITNNSYESYLKELGIYSYDNPSIIKSNKDYEVLVLRDKKEVTISLTSNDKIRYFPKYEILSSTPKFEGVSLKGNVGGSSGGAMQALSIYTALLKIDLKDVKISGTGTIETNDSYEVGKIGGLVQKFHTVKKTKTKYFIIPESQYEEIKHLDKNLKFEIIKVGNFNDLINFISSKIVGELNV